MRTYRDAGFTLIELLVVIAIIAVLAAILFPVFANARERSRQTRCLSNLRELTVAMREYCDDNNGTMPSVGKWMSNTTPQDWCGSQGVGAPVYPEKGTIWRYTRSRGLYICPSDRGRKALEAGGDPNYALSYSMNWYLHYWKIDSIAPDRVTKVLMLIHESRDTINDGLYLWDWWNYNDTPDKVHYDGTTCSYVDGHARWVPNKYLVKQSFLDDWKCYPGQPRPQ